MLNFSYIICAQVTLVSDFQYKRKKRYTAKKKYGLTNTGAAPGCVHFKKAVKACFKAWNAPGTFIPLITELEGSKQSRTGNIRP